VVGIDKDRKRRGVAILRRKNKKRGDVFSKKGM